MTRVLFICLGNICRSPTAHGVLQHKLQTLGLENQVMVDSCGTGDWHIGKAPDPRTVAAAAAHGYDLNNLRARQFTAADFTSFDYILTMDAQNLRDVSQFKRSDFQGYVGRFLDFTGDGGDVPDPYYGGEDGFTDVIKMVEAGCDVLLEKLS